MLDSLPQDISSRAIARVALFRLREYKKRKKNDGINEKNTGTMCQFIQQCRHFTISNSTSLCNSLDINRRLNLSMKRLS